jgi:hypothetical protein
MYNLDRAHERATTDTALFMTADLRERARAQGWEDKVVRKLRVVHKDGQFNVRFPASVGDQAWIAEYGDPDNTPKATIRKYDTTPDTMSKFLGERFVQHMGDND